MIRTLKFFNLLFFSLMIGVNVLANTVPFGKGTTGAISSRYPNLYTPAPVTFSIWGVIYVLVGFYIVCQLGLFNSRAYSDNIVRVVGYWFIISCIMNICWIFSWHHDMILVSVLFMIGLLVSLIILTNKLSLGITDYVTDMQVIPLTARINIYAFDVYLGWICAATIANISVLLVKIGWDRFGLSEEFLTVSVILVGAIIGALFIINSNRYMSALAIVWAYCGILIKHISKSGYDGKYPVIIVVTIIGIFMILAAFIIKTIMDLVDMRDGIYL